LGYSYPREEVTTGSTASYYYRFFAHINFQSIPVSPARLTL
jgi:hypothetical protein